MFEVTITFMLPKSVTITIMIEAMPLFWFLFTTIMGSFVASNIIYRVSNQH